MPTTSLKLPDDIKQRAAAAARRQGVTAHAFMVDAISVATAAAEQRARFVAEAKAARKALLKSGEGFDADEVHAYLRTRVRGAKAKALEPRPWRS